MNKRMISEGAEKRLFSLEEAAQYIGRGKTMTRKYMEEIGASRKMGSRVLFDRVVIDAALDQLCKPIVTETITEN